MNKLEEMLSICEYNLKQLDLLEQAEKERDKFRLKLTTELTNLVHELKKTVNEEGWEVTNG